MPGKYATSGTMALIAADSTLSVISATTVRPTITEFLLSSGSTPNDYSALFDFIRYSDDGTGTSVTPAPLDPADPASLATSKHTYTIEPTNATTTLMKIAHNLRATVRWVAQPGYGWTLPALAADTVNCVCVSVSTQFTEATTIYFEE